MGYTNNGYTNNGYGYGNGNYGNNEIVIIENNYNPYYRRRGCRGCIIVFIVIILIVAIFNAIYWTTVY